MHLFQRYPEFYYNLFHQNYEICVYIYVIVVISRSLAKFIFPDGIGKNKTKKEKTSPETTFQRQELSPQIVSLSEGTENVYKCSLEYLFKPDLYSTLENSQRLYLLYRGYIQMLYIRISSWGSFYVSKKTSVAYMVVHNVTRNC